MVIGKKRHLDSWRRLLGASGLLFLLIFAAYTAYGEMAVRHFFFADDWGWLYFAEFRRYADLFSLLPQQIYNDRPVGAVVIKALYDLFGLQHGYFLLFQVTIHFINSLLLYLIIRRYTGEVGALVGAVVAVTWIVSNGAVYWTAAMFDLMAATLCLLSIMLWQRSHQSKYPVLLLIIGALVYFLATRTKEFAIGLPVIIFAIAWLLEGRSLKQLAKELLPYIMVLTLVAYVYIKLLLSSRLLGNEGDIYGLHFDAIGQNLWFYYCRAFYSDALGLMPGLLVGLIFMLTAILSPQYRRILAVSALGFAVMLGPTLLLNNQLNVLYLYAPHYFLAFAIAGLVRAGFLGKSAAIVIAATLVVVPLNTSWIVHVRNFYDVKTGLMQEQFESFWSVIGEPEQGSKIYIYGVEPYFNPFSFGPGSSIRIMAKDESLSVFVEQPEDELIDRFCAAEMPKYFIVYDGAEARNETMSILSSCG